MYDWAWFLDGIDSRRCLKRLQNKLKNKVQITILHFLQLSKTHLLRPWTNGKCLATKHHQTLFGDQTFYHLDTLFGAKLWFDRVWEGHQTCLMDDVLFVWTAAYQTCLMRACVPRLISGLYSRVRPGKLTNYNTRSNWEIYYSQTKWSVALKIIFMNWSFEHWTR